MISFPKTNFTYANTPGFISQRIERGQLENGHIRGVVKPGSTANGDYILFAGYDRKNPNLVWVVANIAKRQVDSTGAIVLVVEVLQYVNGKFYDSNANCLGSVLTKCPTVDAVWYAELVGAVPYCKALIQLPNILVQRNGTQRLA